MIFAAITCAYAIVLTLIVAGVYSFSFEEGKIKRVEGDDVIEASELKVAVLVAAVSAVAATIVSAFFYERFLAAMMQWATMAVIGGFVCIVDGKKRLIPNRILLVGLTCAVLLFVGLLLEGGYEIQALAIDAFGGALMCGGIFLLSRLITRGGVGFGDVKLYALFGFMAGLSSAFSLLIFSMLAAFLFSIVQLIRKKKTLNDTLPLGPFAFVGVVLCIVLGA